MTFRMGFCEISAGFLVSLGGIFVKFSTGFCEV